MRFLPRVLDQILTEYVLMDYCKYKVCKSCKKEKPDSEFIKADGRHRATRNRCKVCSKEQSNTRKKLRKENPPPKAGKCQVCKVYTTKWVLDHCHTDMTFRGYICTSCNSGIGLLHDYPVILERALTYLRKNNNRSFVSRIFDYFK